MHTSKIIEWNGEFIGAAIMLPEAQGWRFVSANERAAGADGCTAATLGEMQALARRAFLAAQPGRGPYAGSSSAPSSAVH